MSQPLGTRSASPRSHRPPLRRRSSWLRLQSKGQRLHKDTPRMSHMRGVSLGWSFRLAARLLCLGVGRNGGADAGVSWRSVKLLQGVNPCSTSPMRHKKGGGMAFRYVPPQNKHCMNVSHTLQGSDPLQSLQLVVTLLVVLQAAPGQYRPLPTSEASVSWTCENDTDFRDHLGQYSPCG